MAVCAVLLLATAAACDSGPTEAELQAAECAEVEKAQEEFVVAYQTKVTELDDLNQRRAMLSDMDRLNRGSGDVVRAETAVREAFRPILVLVEQNPECFTPAERAQAKAAADRAGL